MKNRDDDLHDGNTIPNINPDDEGAAPELEPHDGNTIMEGPLPEGAFDEDSSKPDAAPAGPSRRPGPAAGGTGRWLPGDRPTSARRRDATVPLPAKRGGAGKKI